VQKYGGSSVADAASVKRVAQRIVDTKKQGNEVVVVVSAMGDTTDELIELAEQVSPKPAARELDMLLTAGERISMAVLAMAIHDLGMEARSYTGSQAGLITDATHGKARIIDVAPERIQQALAEETKERQESELGDLLFAIIQIARWHKLDPSAGLQGTSQRFIQRLQKMEDVIERPLTDYSLEELDALWQQAKAQLGH